MQHLILIWHCCSSSSWLDLLSWRSRVSKLVWGLPCHSHRYLPSRLSQASGQAALENSHTFLPEHLH